MKKISFELFPCELDTKFIFFLEYLKKKNPSFISITNNKNNNFFFIKKIIKIVNTKIVPHLLCDTFFNIIKNILNFIKLKIFNFLIITGDNGVKKSFFFIINIRKYFGHTIKIFSSLYLENHKLNKNVKYETLFNYKKNKIGINLFILQFFFDFKIIKINNFILKKTGINKNFVFGIFPKKKINEILKFSNYCNVELSIWFLKNYDNLKLKNFFFNEFKKIKNLHFYTFNCFNLIKQYFNN